jgi:hypothetical protein
MNLTILALMNLAISTCTAHYGAGLNSLGWYRNQCIAKLETCFENALGETQAKACIAKSNSEKICDGAGNCFGEER